MAARKYKPRAWGRLGELLRERRGELDLRYASEGRGGPLGPEPVGREAFAAERDINPKMAQNVENHDRENYTPVTLRDTIARAYGVTYESMLDVLEEVPGADLEAAPDTPPRRRPGRHRAAGAPAAADSLVPLLSPEREDRARPYHDRIAEARRRWQVTYAAAHPGIGVDDVPEPPGAELMRELARLYAADGEPEPPGLASYAADWDENADVLPPAQRIWLIAELQALRAAARERQAGTG